MLIFREISLRNWRNFGNVNVTLSDRVFIVGANASGKSNFLDVFRFLKDITNIGLQKSVTVRGGIKKLRNLNARTPSYIEIFVKLSDETNDNDKNDVWTYRLQFNAAGGTQENRDINVSLEEITHNDVRVLDRKYNDSNETYLTRQFTYLEQPAINLNYNILFECFRKISYVNIIPQLVREADSFIPSVSSEDFYGRNLLENISATPKRRRETRLRIITRVLKIAVPQFSDLTFMQDDKGRPHLQVRYEHFRPKGAFQQEDQFSDGTLRLIGIIWAILDGDELMLLEEPELYLHSAIVKQLPMFIANAQRKKNGSKRQVFISSHSFDLLSSDTISPEEILVLIPEKEDTSIKTADKIESISRKIDAGFTPADAIFPHVTPKGVADGQLSIFDIGEN